MIAVDINVIFAQLIFLPRKYLYNQIIDKPSETNGDSRDGEKADSAVQKAAAASHTTQTSGGYRAVAPDVKSSHDQAERR